MLPIEIKRNVLLSLTAGLFLSIDSVRGVKEVATNTFYVKIKPGSDGKQNPNDLAHQIARRNGFHNLGPVRHAHKYSTQKVEYHYYISSLCNSHNCLSLIIKDC